MFEISDTVAAVSTPRGKGGIAVIRISGDETTAVLGRVFRAASDPCTTPRKAVFGKIIDAEGQVIDEGIAVFFKGPHSFTGEDVAEISCHGGVLVTECVLAAVLAGYGMTLRRGYRSLGGMNGDIAGAALTVAELCAAGVLMLF